MMKRVLFLGEGDLSGPARYLASVLTWAKIPFDHRPDKAKIPKTWRTPKRYGTIILSDYRYKSFTDCSREWLTQEVRERGTGFLMIGGWASFTGLVGGYAKTEIEKLLPVTCIPGDDRVNCSGGSFVVIPAGPTLFSIEKARTLRGRKQSTKAGIQSNRLGPDSARRPADSPDVWRFRRGDSNNWPMVCGYHHAIPKPGTQTLLTLRDVKIKNTRITLEPPHPLLVCGLSGKGRTAAFLTDCAPHWAGGLVDWGRKRVTVKINAGISTEVGNAYLKFFTNLIHSLMPK
jgi:uncharacterized membrane protein